MFHVGWSYLFTFQGKVVLIREHTTDSAPSLVNNFQVHKRIEFGDDFDKTTSDKHG